MKSVFAGKLPTFTVGVVVATAATAVLAQFCLSWLTVCGVSTPSVLAMCAGLSLGCLFASTESSGYQRLVLLVGVSVLSLMTVVLLDTSLFVGVLVTESAGLPSNVAFFLAGIVAAGFSWILTGWASATVKGSSGSAICLGAAIGCLVPLLNTLGVFPLWIAPILLLVVATFASMKLHTPEPVKQKLDLPPAGRALCVLGLGFYCHACIRMMGLLTPNNAVLLLMSAFVGLVFCGTLSTRLLDKLIQHPALKFPAIAAVVLLPAAFNFLVETNLTWNSTVNSVLSLSLFRSIQLGAMLSAGVLVFRLVQLNSTSESPSRSAWQTKTPSVFVLGLVLGIMSSSLGLNIAFQIFAGVGLLLAPSVFNKKLHPAFATVMGCCGLLLSVFANLNSASTSQKLFSARAANALRLGLAIDAVDQSHCTRLVNQLNGDSGQLTVWKTSAEMVELRRDGIPAGLVSTNEFTTPQSIAEVLTAVLPLSMHQSPQNVMVLGDDTGMCTRVCCSFPLPSIEVSRSDRAATQFASNYAWSDLAASPVVDDRVSIRHESVAAASRRSRQQGKKLDVIISASPNPVSMLCQEQLTVQYYSNLKNQLSANGVFCQRITQHDLGPSPIHRILSSLSSVFGRVVVFQMSAGEMAMVAGVSEESLLDTQLLDRLQRSHVVRELGRSGWSWSQVAALPVVDTSDPVGVFEHSPAVASVTADSGYFALSLPLESARWGNKPAELRSMFAPHQLRMADAAPRGNGYQEYARQYSAVIQQMEILSTFHDEPFAYRKSLKTEMQRNPRPAVEKIRDGKIKQEGDPRDEYRKHYFVSLGNVLNQARDGFADPLALKELQDSPNGTSRCCRSLLIMN